ncbi:CBS domain-containing protein [Herbaspirillum sp. RTI4]|uniref:CBS domain-containing protein n=1 Tax=Herbaspirillum sp. RTI4 TaxID=3048640 RepID=UPI002AB4791B|nr:CBS domain-containing protein [Herbaspirillum sp. RTI4]MDY7577669.1 CBS domain-containing protein [Herbaspirillum sp. RTI4]MEA9982165.1 CBS domain-containing protein [Herbaspirillum sp. RTI4]
MNVQEVMTRKIVTVELDDKLSAVQEIFENLHFHHVLAVEERVLIGIVSDRDLLKALSPYIGTPTESYRDLASLNKRVHQIMSRRPIVLREDATVEDAIGLFIAHKISCIPVVDGDNIPVGILSWRDILRNLGKNQQEK